MDLWVDPNTGKEYSRKEWIIYEQDGMVTRKKRLSYKQLAYLNSLEYQLGYAPRNHENLPNYKATQMIDKLQTRLREKQKQTNLL